MNTGEGSAALDDRSSWKAVALRIAALAVIALVALGALLPARGLSVVLRGGEGGEYPGLPITIVDRGGIVVGVEEATVDFGTDPITSPPGRPNAIVYQWVGGACDRDGRIDIDRTDGSITLLRIVEETGTSCTLQGIGRSIVIEFREPVDPATVIDRTNMLF